MVEINAYSKAKDGCKKLSANFTVKEFACKDGSDAVLTAPRLVMVLQSIRSHFAAPVVIHSAYRTPQYNAKVGGAAHSQHCYGTAADISVKGQPPAAVAAYARELMPDWGGVGVYAGQGFTHIDVRETCPACHGTGLVAPAVLIDDQIEKQIAYFVKEKKLSYLKLRVSPVVAAFVKKGFPSLRTRWMFKYRCRIRVASDNTTGIIETRFFNREDEELI